MLRRSSTSSRWTRAVLQIRLTTSRVHHATVYRLKFKCEAGGQCPSKIGTRAGGASWAWSSSVSTRGRARQPPGARGRVRRGRPVAGRGPGRGFHSTRTAASSRPGPTSNVVVCDIGCGRSATALQLAWRLAPHAWIGSPGQHGVAFPTQLLRRPPAVHQS